MNVTSVTGFQDTVAGNSTASSEINSNSTGWYYITVSDAGE